MEPRRIWRCEDCHTVMISWCGRQNASKVVGTPGQLLADFVDKVGWKIGAAVRPPRFLPPDARGGL
jgi:hypothetical protein